MAEEIYIRYWNAPRLYVVQTLPILFIFKISILVFNFTKDWRRLHREDLYDLYSPNIIRVNKSTLRWSGRVARMGEIRGAYRNFVRRREERRPLGRPRHRWEDGIKIDLQEVGGGMGRIDLAQNRNR